MIGLLWGGSVALALAAGFALGRRRPTRKTTPATLRRKADWHQEYEAKSREHLARNALADAKAAFEKAVQLRTAANLMEEVK